jgi:hypothetical protein
VNRTAFMVVSAVAGIVSYLTLAFYAVVHNHQQFLGLDFGLGFGAIIVSMGGALGIHTWLSVGPQGITQVTGAPS